MVLLLYYTGFHAFCGDPLSPVLTSALDHCLTEVLIFSLLSPHPPELPQIKGEFCFIFKFGVY